MRHWCVISARQCSASLSTDMLSACTHGMSSIITCPIRASVHARCSECLLFFRRSMIFRMYSRKFDDGRFAFCSCSYRYDEDGSVEWMNLMKEVAIVARQVVWVKMRSHPWWPAQVRPATITNDELLPPAYRSPRRYTSRSLAGRGPLPLTLLPERHVRPLEDDE